ncbi:MAG: hypothetical protein FWG31_07435 [Oscillospiraceae bacterium]|nr:hypothetical protein [Oscillospiraceae bacterium]
MRKGCIILVLLISALSYSCTSSSMELSTADVTDIENIFIETEEAEYSSDVETIRYTLTNNTEDELDTEYHRYVVEMYERGEWYTIPFLPSKYYPDIGITTHAGKTSSLLIDIKKDLGKLKKGKYRILHPIGSYPSVVYVISEFTIS